SLTGRSSLGGQPPPFRFPIARTIAARHERSMRIYQTAAPCMHASRLLLLSLPNCVGAAALLTRPVLCPEIRNSKHEIRKQTRSSKSKARNKPLMLLKFRVLDFVLVSDFDIRISSFWAKPCAPSLAILSDFHRMQR